MDADSQIRGELKGVPAPVPVNVVRAGRHTLFVSFPEAAPDDRAEFGGLTLRLAERELSLGRCRFQRHPAAPSRRAGDAAPAGDGKLLFLDQLYDFVSLRGGTVVELRKRLEQLPVLWGRKDNIRPAFREYTAELVFDLQVYRGLMDEVDRNLSEESAAVRDEVHRVVAQSEYPNFRALFDRTLRELEDQVRGFTQEEHERHGFYLRKHVWDIILASEFLRRTNLKPSGYAGDSVMMRLVYEHQFRGPTIFGKFVHRHPLETAAAQAVRNRVSLLSERISRAASECQGRPLRFMSVACGPAWELQELFKTPADFDRYRVTLLDQDPEALAQARAMTSTLEQRHGRPMQVSFVQDSVRTMLRRADLSSRWGRFDFLYSMGLFDYLTAPVAQQVLRRLYGLLEPGGELIIGNYHRDNPTRIYMEYWMDWVLLYRTEDEMRELARGLEGADVSVVFEETKAQMFLCVRKPGAR